MSLTPAEIRHVKLKRSLFGYARGECKHLLEDAAASYEDVWRERGELRNQVTRLEEDLARSRELERTLRDTMESAHQTAEELKEQSTRESELRLEEAEVKARQIITDSERERDRLQGEIARLDSLITDMRAGYRDFLLAALARLEEEEDAGSPKAVEGEDVDSSQSEPELRMAPGGERH